MAQALCDGGEVDFEEKIIYDSSPLFRDIVDGPYTLQQLMEYVSWIGLEGTQAYATTIGMGTTEELKKQYVEGVANSKYTHNCN